MIQLLKHRISDRKMNSFYWHDYETWGTRPSVDRPSQFAGVRTDLDLNIIGEPLVIYCKPIDDVLPAPEACLVTGITPQHAAEQGMVEAKFIHLIQKEFSKPNTCNLGYNTLRFDDEVTRYSLYRNFYDPYEREWKNGNSRWDLIDVVRMCYALRPDGIEWPVVEGKPSFKLENLSAANKLKHGSAHDAFSDVEATIALAKLLKQKQPKLFDFAYNNRGKKNTAEFIDIKSRRPLLHISSKYSSERGCAGIIAPLAAHPTNKNAVIVLELSVDPSPLETLSAEQIRERMFTRSEDLKDGEQRLPIKLVHLNKCPILAPTNALGDMRAKELGIDKSLCEKHWQKLLNMDLEYKMRQVFELDQFPPKTDPEQMLYQGFLGDEDKRLCQDLRRASIDELTSRQFIFQDPRLNAMLLAYRARNFPHCLNDSERAEWHELVKTRLQSGEEHIMSLAELKSCIEALKLESAEHPNYKVLDSLYEYAVSLASRYGLA